MSEPAPIRGTPAPPWGPPAPMSPTATPSPVTGADRAALADLPLRSLLAAIADQTPAPGGGAVAAIAAAVGAALGRMVLAYTRGRRRFAEHAAGHDAAELALADAANAFLRLADDDAAAYAALNELLRLPEGDAHRLAGLPAAIVAAIGAPDAMLTRARDEAELLAGLVGTTNPRLDSDLAIAISLTACAAEAAAWNVHANLSLLNDAAEAARLAASVRARLDAVAAAKRAAPALS